MTVHRDGMACGLSQWPRDRWSAGPMNATMQGILPKYLPAWLAQARKAGIRIVCVFPRTLVTQNGQTRGLYSIDKAKALAGEYTRYLSPSQMRDYVADKTLLGFSAGDDFGDAASWGGKVVTPAMSYEVVGYAKAKFGDGVPVGLRQPPAWIAGSEPLAKLLDFGWLQWLLKRGDPQLFYDKGWAIAQKYGFNMCCGINVHSCYMAGEDHPCPEDVLWKVGCLAQDHPSTRVCISWRYDPDDWRHLGPTWTSLAERAATKPNRSLLRGAA